MLKLELTNFDEFGRLLDPDGFRDRLITNIGRATLRIALDAEREIKEDMTKGKFKKNSPVTSFLKGSSRPLVNTGELLKAINARVTEWDQAVVGVIKAAAKRDKKGKFVSHDKKLLNVARIVHEGASINVTKKMRMFFFILARENPGQVRPIKSTTKVIVIPPRPFLESAVKNSQVSKYETMWANAINNTFGGVT